MATSNHLPKLAELHHDIETAFKNDQYKLLVNQPPHASWIKKHPLAKVKNEQGQNVAARYLPTDKVEFLLDRIFQDWKVEVLREGQMFNSVYCTIRLHYKHPVTGDWLFHDGVGAKSVQTDAGFSPADLAHIKDAAVQMALPSAKSYAIKDAADHIGKLFGRDLNRTQTMNFAGAYAEYTGAAEQEQPQPQAQQPQQTEETDFPL